MSNKNQDMERALRAFCVLKLVLGTMKYHGIMNKQVYCKEVGKSTFSKMKATSRDELRNKKNT